METLLVVTLDQQSQFEPEYSGTVLATFSLYHDKISTRVLPTTPATTTTTMQMLNLITHGSIHNCTKLLCCAVAFSLLAFGVFLHQLFLS